MSILCATISYYIVYLLLFTINHKLKKSGGGQNFKL